MAWIDGNDHFEVLTADRQPCPVCGDPTGDCPGSAEYDFDLAPPRVDDDPLATFTVPRRVFEETVDKTGRVRRRLVYARGDRIRPQQAKEIGLMK